jgi:hypothetical protein
MLRILLILTAVCCRLITFAQSADPAYQGAGKLGANINSNTLLAIQHQYTGLEENIQRHSNRLLARLQKQELKLQRKLNRKDSLLAKNIFAQSQQQYQSLQAKLSAPPGNLSANSLKEYIPSLDSISTAVRFLKQSPVKFTQLSSEQLKQVQGLGQQVQALQSRLQQAADIQAFIKQRRELLKAQLENLGLTKQFNRLNKEVYYYQQRIAGYKAVLKDKQQLETKALAALRELPAFKDFMQKNSYLSQLFPAGAGNAAGGIDGLQTRDQVQALISQRIGTSAAGSLPGSGPDNTGQAYVQQQLQSAQNQLSQLKDKLNQLGGGSSDLVMPDFNPNNQKTKTFLQRLEYGFNIQSQNNRSILPATTDLGLSLGYRLNDKAVVGIGGSYKQGWGTLFNHIRLSGQGMSIRSFIDIKAKGSFWISGGYEWNYLTGLDSLSRMYSNITKWQRSGLVGLTKKYKVGKKEGKLQLLWDFLSQSQSPKAPALKFRIGYSL